ncbi:MAG: hypothetical protein EPO68_14270 [Planctomycetota bacterium]|nr:MAG: hypothetical protein EPO68_14270 [Planctomycetota bacterium]
MHESPQHEQHGASPDPRTADGAITPWGPRDRDRRRERTPRFSRFSFFGGRRRRARREHELEGSFVDLYGHRLWVLAMWTALMNTGDCFFTLVHLQAGGTEVNPIAAVLLGTGRLGFVLWKSLLIGLALLVLVQHKNFTLARFGLWTACGGYTLLFLYHLLLFRF